MQAKNFSRQFNEYLDKLGMPMEPHSRSMILSKILHISRQSTRMIIDGYKLPDAAMQQQLKKELDWDYQQ
jgi:hypothetical protein